MPPGFDYEVCPCDFTGSYSDPGPCDRRCAWFSSSDDSETQTPAAQPQDQATASEAAPEPAPAPVKDVPGKSKSKTKANAEKASAKKAPRGAKSEAEISAELDRVGHKLALQASRTVMPSKASKEVRKDGKDYVASYVEVDTSNVTTELRPGASGQYVGFIRYRKKFMNAAAPARRKRFPRPASRCAPAVSTS